MNEPKGKRRHQPPKRAVSSAIRWDRCSTAPLDRLHYARVAIIVAGLVLTARRRDPPLSGLFPIDQ
jgi:hypothetical protein